MRPILYVLLAALFLQPSTIVAQQDPIYLQEIKIRTAIHAHDLATVESLLAPGFLEVEDTISTRRPVRFPPILHGNQLYDPQPPERRPPPTSPSSSIPLKCTGPAAPPKTGEFNYSTTWVRHSGKWQAVLPSTRTPSPPNLDYTNHRISLNDSPLLRTIVRTTTYARKVTFSANSMVQAFPAPQDVVGVRRWRVRCGLPTIRPEPCFRFLQLQTSVMQRPDSLSPVYITLVSGRKSAPLQE